MDLLDKISSRQATVSIIGLGYVGLPLAIAFAEAGFRVIGIDVDNARVDAVNRRESLQDIPQETLALHTIHGSSSSSKRGQSAYGNAGRLAATTDFDALVEADAAIICVPTPLSKTKDPDMSYVIAAADEVARRLHPGMLVVLESTVYPGTTEELFLSQLQHTDGQMLNVGADFFLAFSPERIDPGSKEWTIRNTPKVIGGVTPSCLEVATALYRCVVLQVVPASSTKVAEMSKLLENTFRAVNIALANEFAIMCDRLGIDVWEVIDAASTKPFGFMPFYPGPGLGGHCLPIDPQYLAWKLKSLNYNARFIQLAEEINFAMPRYVAEKVADALNREGKPLKSSRVLVLGVTYKADVIDLRESPALDLISLLREKGVDVAYHDPFVPQLDVDGVPMTGVTLDVTTLRAADCIVITTAHSSYNWKYIVEHSQVVVDTRNATAAVAANSAKVVKL